MSEATSKIVYLTAGAGGMFCGSCMHDNALAKALSRLGFDIQLVPTYTPIRTDESDFSVDQVFFGGINVYLQQKIPPLRWLPRFLDRFLDNPKLIRRVTSRSMDMAAEELGKLAVSMLKGIKGNQRKEVLRLCHWLKTDASPDLVVFTNALIGGCIPEIKKQTGKPIVVTLQGDDVFLDSLPDKYKSQCIKRIEELDQNIDGYIVHTEFFKEYMADYFSIPSQKIHVTPLGIEVDEIHADTSSEKNNRTPTIGYLARIAPEKGFHNLIDTFVELKKRGSINGLKMRAAGWLGKPNEQYFADSIRQIPSEYASDFEYIGSIERDQKFKFLTSIDVLSVPTQFKEPKGLYALEAMACGIPVVKPNHGAFPELINESGGGLLFEQGNTQAHCQAIESIFSSVALRTKLGQNARSFVLEKRNSHEMGQSTAKVIRQFVS